METWSWNKQSCGDQIQVKENSIWLEESSEAQDRWKSILGDQGFYEGVHEWEVKADARTEQEFRIGVSTQPKFDFNTCFSNY